MIMNHASLSASKSKEGYSVWNELNQGNSVLSTWNKIPDKNNLPPFIITKLTVD